MGRHAGSGPPPEPRARLTAWVERALLGIGAGGVIAVVMRWANASVKTSVIVGIVVLVLVPVAAWISSTVPSGAPDEPTDSPRQTRSRGGA